MRELREIFQYREMILLLVRRDLRVRYKRSFLGFAWTFLNPLLQLLVYTVVFSVIMRAGVERYYLFLFVALIPWMAMAGSVANGSTCITTQAGLVTKIYFPRRVLPITAVTTNFVNMALCMLVVLAVCACTVGLRLSVLWYLIPAFFLEYLLALGIALLVSGLTVYFRDLEYILSILTMAWQFLSPVMYSVDMVPENLRPLFYLNPMTSILVCFRAVLYGKTAPRLSDLLLALGAGLFFLLLGWYVFGRLEKRFAEEL